MFDMVWMVDQLMYNALLDDLFTLMSHMSVLCGGSQPHFYKKTILAYH